MAQRKKKKRADRSMWKMSPERLEEHLKLRSRATRIPDKKKEQSKKACRNTRQAFGLVWGEKSWVCASCKGL
ncbi:hypothetical protein [Corynebacterium sp. HMSC05E07]|uniref:hypothetical protein n=1 Tax=Corynebacterium sp. HMSC05E07 TaxID=1581117 RepID=UPI0008A41A9C|nr:hypothetical protein [Corynebacterium sp. HMSC05E07]OFT58803.1 hypothetical protein HMPREF3149_10620 [Corynebacterium sp. HMSC05E07]